MSSESRGPRFVQHREDLQVDILERLHHVAAGAEIGVEPFIPITVSQACETAARTISL